jgi:hypothetical protein
MRVAVRRLSRSRSYDWFDRLSGVRVIHTTEYASRHFVRCFATTIGLQSLWLSVSQVTEKNMFDGAKFTAIRSVCTRWKRTVRRVRPGRVGDPEDSGTHTTILKNESSGPGSKPDVYWRFRNVCSALSGLATARARLSLARL